MQIRKTSGMEHDPLATSMDLGTVHLLDQLSVRAAGQRRRQYGPFSWPKEKHPYSGCCQPPDSQESPGPVRKRFIKASSKGGAAPQAVWDDMERYRKTMERHQQRSSPVRLQGQQGSKGKAAGTAKSLTALFARSEICRRDPYKSSLRQQFPMYIRNLLAWAPLFPIPCGMAQRMREKPYIIHHKKYVCILISLHGTIIKTVKGDLLCVL